ALSSSFGTNWMKPLPSRLVPWIASMLMRASPRILPRRAKVPGVSCTVTLNSTGIFVLRSGRHADQRRFHLLQPICHPHLPVHRRRGGEVLLRLLALAGAPIELAEAEVAVGDEGATGVSHTIADSGDEVQRFRERPRDRNLKERLGAVRINDDRSL